MLVRDARRSERTSSRDRARSGRRQTKARRVQLANGRCAVMTTLQANCPACGAPVSFKTGSSVVVVCEHCQSVVARTDRALEDLGKVAEIADTGSPLDVGL